MNTFIAPKLPPLPEHMYRAPRPRGENKPCVGYQYGYTASQMNDHYLKGYNDAIAAIEAQGVPDGWQLVPKEPTQEMLQAALDYHGSSRYQDEPPLSDEVSDTECYAAMLAAAPPAP